MQYRIWMAAAIVAMQWSTKASTNEIIVSATRIETPVSQLSTSVDVITEDDIENSKFPVVADLLQTVPGVAMSRSGGPGQATQIYLRGAKPQHTLVLIDGVRMNGQLDLNGYNPTDLQVLDIERIEIMKGPHSPLYGSDAMAGVINIVTRKGQGNPSPYVDVEGGSYGTWRAATGVSGGDDRVDYSASISRYDRQGESALKNNTEKDGTRNTTVSARVGATPVDNGTVALTVRYIDATSDYDDGFGTAHAAFKYDTEQLVTRATGSSLLFDELLETRLGVSYLMVDRFEHGFSSTYEADTTSADWNNTFYLHDDHTLMVGIDGYYDDFFFDEGFGAVQGDLHNLGAFATYQGYLADPWILNLGVRHDDHSEFNGETTCQASSAYIVDATRTKFRASYGTGFKAPNSYQLFASFGNPDLMPEKSRGWEAGFDQQILTNRLSVGATCFRTDYDDLIDFDLSTFTYGNIAKARTDGAEAFAVVDLLDNLRLRLGYTYLDNDDLSGGTFTLRRPQHQIDSELNFAATSKLNVNLYAGFVGAREDVGNLALEAYSLVNLAVRYQIAKKVQLYGRIENLLDEDYETIAGYNTDDLSFYAGIKVGM